MMRKSTNIIMSKKRRNKKAKKLIKGVAAWTVLIMVAGSGVFGVSRLFGTDNTQTVNQNESQTDNAIVVDNNIDKVFETQPQAAKVVYPYATVSSSYVNVDSEKVLNPYIAILDVDSNKIVAGRECNERIYPASMTKVMTLIVAVENLKNLEQTYTMTSDITYPLYLENATVAGFLPDEIINAKDMLYGLILPSGADAAIGLAQMISGAEDEFVKLMNAKCEELGLKNTHFVNTSGLHDDDHYTTPLEMAMIMKYAMANPTCAEVLSTYQYTTAVTEQHPEGILLTSTMFSRMYGTEVEGVTIVAGKTGYTQEARHCMVSYGIKGDKKYVVVTAGAQNKWNSIFDDFELYRDFTL